MRPSLEDTLISIAFTVSKRSTCTRGHNGAVIATPSGVILSTGYNGAPSGMPHCEHECNCSTPLDHSSECLTQIGCTTAVHAEANAVYFAARNGISTNGAIMYSTSGACIKCAEAIIQSGITSFVYDLEYRVWQGVELLKAAGVEVKRHG